QLQADGGDAPEVSRSGCTLGSGLARIHPALEAGWVELVGRRCEHDIDALSLRDLEIAGLVARIRVEIPRLVELRGIDEERHDDAVVLLPGRAEQRDVAVVEGSHRRYQPRARGGLQLGDRADELHTSATVAPASVS